MITFILALLTFILLYYNDGSHLIHNIDNICIIVLAFYSVYRFNIKIYRKFLPVNLAFTAFALSSLASGVINQNVYFVGDNTSTIFDTYRDSLMLIIFPYVLEYLCSTNKLGLFFKYIMIVASIALVSTDLFALLHTYVEDHQEIILISNKFGVSYLHLIYICGLWFYLHYHRPHIEKLIIILLILLTLVISQWIQCSTGVAASAFLLILYIFQKFKKKITRPIFIYVAFFLSVIFVFYINDILSNNTVIYVLEQYLNTDASLTGRTQIYDQAPLLIALKPLMGWGPNKASLIVQEYIGYGNIQNGVLQNIMTYGIIGSAFILLIVLSSLEFKKEYNKDIYPFFALIFTFILMSTIEVSLGSIFIYLILYMVIAKYYLYKQNVVKKDILLN